MTFHFGTRAAERERYREVFTEKWNAGASPVEIAAHIGKNVRTIWRMAHRYGLDVKARPRTERRPHSEGDCATVARMWAEGATGQAIADAIGRSRNAVSGLVSRLGLPKRSTGPRPAQKIAKNEAPPPPIGPINDFPPTGTCQYTADHPGQGADWRMCGHPGFPWCEHHRPICTQKVRVSP
jgi:hypothetical protein